MFCFKCIVRLILFCGSLGDKAVDKEMSTIHDNSESSRRLGDKCRIVSGTLHRTFSEAPQGIAVSPATVWRAVEGTLQGTLSES